MGWSCTSAASRAMERLADACVKASGGSQNRFPAGGDWFFWEHDYIEYEDGHVTGCVHREVGPYCEPYAHFEITPRGDLLMGHKWMRDALAP